MKTTAPVAIASLRKFIRCASLAVMISVTASALIGTRPAFAQTGWDESPDVSLPSDTAPALAPAPEEQAEPQLAPPYEGYTSEAVGGSNEPWMQRPEAPFAQPFVSPSIPAAGQMPEFSRVPR